MIPHFLDKFNAKKLWSTTEVLICGKGPSYDLEKIRKFKGIIAGINIVPTRGAFVFCNDLDCWVRANNDRNNGIIVIAYHPHFIYDKDKPFVVYYKNVNECKDHLKLNIHATYELHTNPKPTAFPNHLPIFCHASTFEAALTLFTLAGVRKFFTSGIDGGNLYNSQFLNEIGPDNKKDKLNNFDNQFITVDKLKKEYGITVDKL